MVKRDHIVKALATFVVPVPVAVLVVAGVLFHTAPVCAQDLEGRNAIGSAEDAALIATLIRSNLISLHLAMMSGNFSVMRDLAAPSFRERNTNADLARIFEPIRQSGINLEAVAVLQPELEAAIIDKNKLLWIAGTFRTRPHAVRFKLAFQVVNKSWSLFGLRVVPLEALTDTRGTGRAHGSAPETMTGPSKPPAPQTSSK